MKSFRKYLPGLVAALVGVAMLATPTQARAEFQMKISWTSGGGGSVLVHDNDVNDTGVAHTVTGAITFSGAVGNIFLTVNTGVSKPISGSAALPDMDLNFSAQKIAGSGGETLTIEISDVGFTTSPIALTNQIGGTFSGSFTQTTAQSFFDNGDTNFGKAHAGTLMTFNSSPYSGSNVLNVTGAAPYSLTQTIVLTAGVGAGNSTGDFEILPTPAPAGLVLALTGTPVLGLGAWLRRRRIATAA